MLKAKQQKQIIRIVKPRGSHHPATGMRLCSRKAGEVSENECSKDREVLEEYLLQSATPLRLGRFIFQQENEPKDEANDTKKWLQNNNNIESYSG